VARESIVQVMAKDKPINDLDARMLAKKTKHFSGADLKAIFDQGAEEALTLAMKEGRIVPMNTKALVKVAKSIVPSSKPWFESAKNYAMYANQSGFYDDVLSFLGIKK
jgi:SpoVK/Ycf46/Vps4 family AAA+-type ATPase